MTSYALQTPPRVALAKPPCPFKTLPPSFLAFYNATSSILAFHSPSVLSLAKTCPQFQPPDTHIRVALRFCGDLSCSSILEPATVHTPGSHVSQMVTESSSTTQTQDASWIFCTLR